MSLALNEVDDNENAAGYNCELCIAKGLMGARPGRLCLLYQVDFGEDVLEYKTVTRQGPLSGDIKSEDDMYLAIQKLSEHHKTDKVDLVLRYIKLKGKRLSGVCPKSVPKTDMSIRLLSLLNTCLGGDNGTQLLHLPFPGTIIDQPNIFIESHYIWIDEYSRFMKAQREKEKSKSENRR